MSYSKEVVLREEDRFQFDSFSNEEAWVIGDWLACKARINNLSIAIRIEICGHTLFQYANTGTTINNENWLKAKTRTVHYFGCSSLATQLRLEDLGISLEEDSKISSSKYFPVGGAFPIRIRNTGVVGSIAISGLHPEEDHKLIIECLTDIRNK